MGLAIWGEEEANDPQKYKNNDRPKLQKQHPNKIQTAIDTKNTHY